MNLNLGISKKDLQYIIDTIKNFPEVKQAKIYGSRAMGNYKQGSDIDIAIIGEDIDFSVISKIHYLLEEESPMPYFFDITDYNNLSKPQLKQHIDQYGKIIFTVEQ